MLEVAIVISHAATGAHPPTLIAVVIDDRASIPGCISRACVAGALTNLRQLTAHVIEELVVNRRGGAKLFFRHSPERRIDDSCRVCAVIATISQITCEAAQSANTIVAVSNRMPRRIRERRNSSRKVVRRRQ